MKKYFVIILVLISLGACSAENKNSTVSATIESDGYHEYETNLTREEVEEEMLPSKAAEKEKERLIKAGVVFWGSEKVVDGFEPMKIYDIKKPWPEDTLDAYSYRDTTYYLR